MATQSKKETERTAPSSDSTTEEEGTPGVFRTPTKKGQAMGGRKLIATTDEGVVEGLSESLKDLSLDHMKEMKEFLDTLKVEVEKTLELCSTTDFDMNEAGFKALVLASIRHMAGEPKYKGTFLKPDRLGSCVQSERKLDNVIKPDEQNPGRQTYGSGYTDIFVFPRGKGQPLPLEQQQQDQAITRGVTGCRLCYYSQTEIQTTPILTIRRTTTHGKERPQNSS